MERALKTRQGKPSQDKRRQDKRLLRCFFCLRLPLVRAILGPGAVRIHLGNTCRYTANKLNLHQGFCIVTTTLQLLSCLVLSCLAGCMLSLPGSVVQVRSLAPKLPEVMPLKWIYSAIAWLCRVRPPLGDGPAPAAHFKSVDRFTKTGSGQTYNSGNVPGIKL